MASKWSRATLSTLVSSLEAGVSVNSNDRPPNTGELGVLKTSAISGGTFNPNESKTVLPAERSRVCTCVTANCIIVSRMNTPELVGESALVDDDFPNLFLPDRLWLMMVQDERCQARWLSHFLRSSISRRFIAVSATGTSGSMKNLPKPRFLAMPVDVPPLPEQRAIAAVLDTIDDAIQKTEQIIAKLQQVKQGLLHDLLTRGIDDNGELRDPERHPEQFQDSPLGRIPKGWEVVRLRDEIRIEHGFAFPGTGFVDEPRGPVLLTPGNFHRDGGLYFERSNTKHFIGSVPVGYVLRAGDIVTVMTDLSPRTLILGRTEVVGTERTLLHNQRIGKVVPLRVGRWTNNLLAMAMSQPPIRGRVVREATGTTVRHTSPDRILACCIARPGMAEQEVILQVMAAEMVREAIELETHRRLVALRAGLSEDLLTGRVRTTSLPGFSA